MNQISTAQAAEKRSPGQLLESVLSTSIRNRSPQRLLLIHSAPEDMLDLDTHAVMTIVSCGLDLNLHGLSVVCDTDELPFAGESFQMVVINGLVHKGNEDVIEEAIRVLASRGVLAIIGRGQLGRGDAAALNPFSVCRRLKGQNFVIKRCEGFGLWGRAMHFDRKWQKPLLAASDRILITGQLERIKPVVTHLRFSQPHTAGAQSAALDGLRRASQ